jgi:hypothetical protein
MDNPYFSDKFTPTRTLELCREVFVLLHKRGLSNAETLATSGLLFALAAKSTGLPERGARDMLKATFKLVDDMGKK